MNNLDLMRTRLENRGGADQQARMIKDKRRTLDRVVNYSYQGATVRRPGEIETARALIGPNQVKQDYDEKILSIGFEYNYKPGDVFEWVGTGTKWLIYLQELTELAYFRGNVRKCSYQISWEDENGQYHNTYAAVVGPQSMTIQSIQRSNFSLDIPNYTLHMLLPKNAETLAQFKRYGRFFLKGTQGPDAQICWRVEATDTISTPGILEVYAAEYYSNAMEDDIENGIVGGLIVEPSVENISSEIQGEIFIKPKKAYTYEYIGNDIGEWVLDTRLPIEFNIDEKTITIKWLNTYSGEFILQYGSIKKTIVVESLF